MGAQAYHLIKLVRFLPDQVAIEIGAERGEGSTEYLSNYLKGVAPFYSVDIMDRGVNIVMDGKTWLEQNTLPIKFAYLDNFDFIFTGHENAPWLLEQIEDYKTVGLEMNNQNSKQAHLEQARLVHEQSAPFALTIIDDTWYVDGQFDGKGGEAVPWLKKHGWEIINEVGDGIDSFVALRRKI